MNAGKSSLLNRITGQQVAIVSPEAGTTTDLVRRSYEITGYGPVVFIDTAGIDDTSPLGELRVQKTRQSLAEIDLAIVLLVGSRPDAVEEQLIERIEAGDIPYLLLEERGDSISTDQIVQQIREALPKGAHTVPRFFGDREIRPGEVILLVCPIDTAAPEGRLILPQVQAMRAALDAHAVAITVQPDELETALKIYPVPRLVVTDSQAFGEVGQIVPEGVELTSFSVLLADQKGDKAVYQAGLEALGGLRSGDRILIIENCSHQVTCDDIGRVKIPAWLREYGDAKGITGLDFDFVTGRDPLPTDLARYALAVQCGGCVSTRRMIQGRIRAAVKAGLPITNYGMLIRKLRLKNTPTPKK